MNRAYPELLGLRKRKIDTQKSIFLRGTCMAVSRIFKWPSKKSYPFYYSLWNHSANKKLKKRVPMSPFGTLYCYSGVCRGQKHSEKRVKVSVGGRHIGRPSFHQHGRHFSCSPRRQSHRQARFEDRPASFWAAALQCIYSFSLHAGWILCSSLSRTLASESDILLA